MTDVKINSDQSQKIIYCQWYSIEKGMAIKKNEKKLKRSFGKEYEQRVYTLWII